MNPFSGFLTPQNNQPIDVRPIADAFGRMQQQQQFNAKMAEDRRQADQNNAVAKGYLGVQQDQLGFQKDKYARQVSKEDQAEVEGLLAEYQDAVAQGNPEVVANVTQKLKRYGIDFSQKQPEPQVQNFGKNPFTGMPLMTRSPLQLQKYTVGDEQMSMARPDAPEEAQPDNSKLYVEEGNPLTQDEFEKRLVEGRDAGERPEQLEPQGEEGVINLDAEPGAQPLSIGGSSQQAPQASQSTQMAPGLPGGLPVILSKGGKQLYETGNQGRWAPLIGSVFDPLATDPKSAKAGKLAKDYASKLIQVDGVAPKEAIKAGMDLFEKQMARDNALARTTIGARARASAAPRETAESIDKYGDNIRQELSSAGVLSSDAKLSAAEEAIMSDDPALQKDALKQILLARSGLTVSEGERRSYTMVDGLIPFVQNTWAQWSGQPMSPQTRQSLLNIIQNMRNANSAYAESIKKRERGRYEAQNENKLSPQILKRRGDALAPDPNADLYQ